MFPEEWTGDVVKKMHLHNIKQSEVAEKVGVSRELVCKTLKGKHRLKNGEQRFNEAIDTIINNRCRGEK